MDTINCENLVVGAGIVGSCIAHQLKKNGHEVVVIDQGFGGHGATSFSAGLRFPFGRKAITRVLAAQSDNFYSTVPSELFVHLDAVAACCKGGEDDFLEACSEKATLLAGNMRLSPAGVFVISHAQNTSAFSLSDCFHSIPQRVVDFLWADSDIRPLWGTRLTSVRRDENGAFVDLADGRRITCRRAVVAAGPWVKPLLPASDLPSKGIRIKKIVAFHLPNHLFPENSLFYFPDNDAFILNSSLYPDAILSITSEQWDVEPGRQVLEVTSHDRIIGRSVLNRYFPFFDIPLFSARVFCDSYSDNGAPSIIGADDRVTFVSGMNGSGFRLAPGIALQATRGWSDHR